MMRLIKDIAKQSISSSLFHTGYYDSLLEKIKNKAVVLMYHRISNGDNGQYSTSFETGVSADNFEQQIRYLKEKMNIMSLEDIVSCVKKGDNIPSKSVSITFDDGYDDVYTSAYPIMKKYDIPATVYITTGSVDTNSMFWWDKVGELIKKTKNTYMKPENIKELKSDSIKIPPVIYLRNKSEKDHAHYLICERLKLINPENIGQVINMMKDELGVELDDLSTKGNKMLGWHEIKEMAANGITIGAHTVTHPNLAAISDSDAEKEIVKSKRDLEERLKISISGFAYPFGSHNHYSANVRKIVEKSGFNYACTTVSGIMSAGDNMYEIPRLGVSNMPLPVVIRNICKYI